jgi:hypothetical protein
VITVGTNADDEIVIRNHGNGTVLEIEADPETFAMLVGMLVDELNDLDEETDYVLQEYVPRGGDDG